MAQLFGPFKKIEKAVPEPVKPKPDFEFKLLESYTIRDTEKWREWRKERAVPSASMLSSCYGLGYNSLQSEIGTLVGTEERPEPNYAIKQAMSHGNEFEHEARSHYLKNMEIDDIKQLSAGEISEIYEITDNTRNGYKCKFMITPDLVFTRDSDPDNVIVVEIKCPAYGIRIGKRQPIHKLCDYFLEKHAHGKSNHFLQAACYALFKRARMFKVHIMFTDSIDAKFACFTYMMTPELESFLFMGIFRCDYYLFETAKFGTSNPIKIPAKFYEKRVLELMADSFVHLLLDSIDEVLQEDSSDEGQDERKEIPREVC